MNIKFKYWQAVLLCFPFVLSVVVIDIPRQTLYGHQTTFAISNFLMVFDICLLIYYQTYLALAFNNRSEKKSNLFKINALIPTVFFTWYLSKVTYATFFRSTIVYEYLHQGSVMITKNHPANWIIVVFFIQALITFVYINRRYIASTINELDNAELQIQLKADYLVPMQILIRVVIMVCVATLFIDVVRMMING